MNGLDHHDALLDRDWADVWESLPEAPALVPRLKTAQITLRIPATVLARTKRVAAARTLPYHALARSWIIDGLHQAVGDITGATTDEPQTEQLNVKLDDDILDALKVRAGQLQHPYHRLAREWIEAALSREEKRLGFGPELQTKPFRPIGPTRPRRRAQSLRGDASPRRAPD